MLLKKFGLSKPARLISLFYVFLLICPPVYANPTGPEIVHGQVSMNRPNSGVLNITNSPNALINWQGFSIQQNEITRFLQESPNSAVLNRVVGQDLSQIFGQLLSNGRVFLINPNGIVFGSNAVIDTVGFVASTLNITDKDFLEGNLRFEGDPDSGSIINQGFITAGTNKDIYLIAPNIENRGIIQSDGGNLILAAGESITITSLDMNDIHFEIQAPENKVLNLGKILADGGTAGIFAGTLRHSGEIRANTVSVDETGSIILSASSVVTDGEIAATGNNESGGDIIIKGSSWVSLGGTVDASGKTGGSVSVQAGNLSIAAPVLAKGTTGLGGDIDLLTAGKTLETVDTLVDVSGAEGGTISHIAGLQITTSGTYLAEGLDGPGGKIDLTAPAIKLLSSEFAASGLTGGGSVRIGGEFQGGKNLAFDEIPNAQILAVTDATRIVADTTGPAGDGGEVIVWADQKAVFLGDISAIPGTESGAGGFAEVSSGDKLTFNGDVVTGLGERKGSFLLDPKNITIADESYSQYGLVLGFNYSDVPGLTATIDAGDELSYGLSLDGTRLAVGAPGDDGAYGSVGSNFGAVHLFTFTDSTFNGAQMIGSIGNGYSGGKNIDVGSLDSGDNFGYSVSLDGNRLAAGARYDDGWAGTSGNAGAVHLFSFTDSNFSGGAHEATLGFGYSPGNTGNAKSRDIAGLDPNDQFGSDVSLSGNFMAVSAWLDDGNSGTVTDSGSVRLFSFTDSLFNGSTQNAIIGRDYGALGAPNLSVSSVDSSDWFGTSVSLDGDSRLAVGSSGDDGGGTDTGAVYLFTFTPGANFTGGTLEETMGEGYSISVAGLDNNDFFGSSVSLDGNRLAVGAFGNDGFGVGSEHPDGEGAVHLFTFATSDFTGAVQEGAIGMGYTGSKDVNIGTLGAQDRFGSAVSLDGTRLAVGAMWDDGNGDVGLDSGAVYLLTYEDANFNGGALQGTIGYSYTSNKDINIGLEADDYLGVSASLDGTRLAIGAYSDDGAENIANLSGAVRLFSFADTSFNSPQLQAVIGRGYTGGKNYDIGAELEASDRLGISVSLDGNRLAVGANYEDGAGNAVGNSGAVYLFSFTDSAFSGPALEAKIGNGYSGGKNFDVAALEAGDLFGTSLSLDGNRLVVGTISNDGAANLVGDSGAVYLFTFTDNVFSGPALTGTIGDGYAYYNLSSLDGGSPGDHFGRSVSLDGNLLAVGAWQDDGAGNSVGDSGAAYLFSFSDLIFNNPALEGIIGKGYTGGKNFDLSSLGSGDYAGTSISLDDLRLAIGAYGDDGAVFTSAAGAVYLFSFTGNFTGLTLESTIGKGYSGGNNFDLAQLEATDRFGYSVSLDGDRLVTGAVGDDGAGNDRSFAGTVYFFSFADSVFNGGSLEGTLGYGYTGGKDLDLSASLDSGDYFGTGVSLDGTRLAVGARSDDGLGNSLTDSGAVHLFSFADTDFNSPVLEAILGAGYTGGKNLDLSASLDDSDGFGISVSLDGTRLAVGAGWDDGLGNSLIDSGAVHLFSFADTDFNTPVLEATLGAGYTGGKNLDLSASLDVSDWFGYSVSLDGIRLAEGTLWDDGLGNSLTDSGAAHLFSFADTDFNTPVLEATLGAGYTGGKNLNLSTILDASDYLGSSVSLDGTRLAVGTHYDDGSGNSLTDSGAVHLFSFADTDFNTPVLEAILGAGYTGGKNLDLSASLDATDRFGISVYLDGTRLAAGAHYDDGLGNSLTDSGAVRLFSFADTAFNTPVMEATLGAGYTGGNNLDLSSTLDENDYFGRSVSLDGTRLAVGSNWGDGSGNILSDSGAVYFFNLVGGDPVSNAVFANNSSGESTITPASLVDLLDNSQNVILQANNDFLQLAGADIIVSAGGSGGDLTIEAGRSAIFNADIFTDNGNLAVYGNRVLSAGAIDAERDAGAAVITMATGTTLDTGNGVLTLAIETDAGKADNTTGDITLENLKGADISITSLQSIHLQKPVEVTSGSFTLDAGNDIFINAQIGTAGDRFDHNLMLTAGNNIDVNSPVYLNDKLFSATATDISFDALVDVGSGTIHLEADGSVTQSAPLTAGLAELLGNGDYTLDDPGNLIDALKVDAGSVTLNNAGSTILNGFEHVGDGSEYLAFGHAPVAEGKLGTAIAKEGDVMVVGAVYEASYGSNLDGAVYIYRWNGSTWVFEQKLISPDLPTADGQPDKFGASIAVEGNLIVVGAPERSEPGYFRHGAAYAYHHNGSTWVYDSKISFSDETFENHFGDAMDIDSGRLVVGGNGRTSEGGFWTGKIWFFDYMGGAGSGWSETGNARQSDPVGNDYFGSFLDISGDHMIVGAPSASNAGKAYIFEYNAGSGTWSETQKLTASDATVGDRFSFDVSIRDDIVAVGTYPVAGGDGSAYVFRYDGTTWNEEKILVASDLTAGDVFGYKVSVGEDVVAISSHGHEVGAVSNAGSVYVYEYDGANWLEARQATADVPEADAYFGRDVLLDNKQLYVGSIYADEGATANAGRVYVIDPFNMSKTAGVFAVNATGDLEVANPLRAGGSVNLTTGGDLFIHASVESTAGNMQLTGPQEMKVVNNYTLSGQHVSINVAGDLEVDGLGTGYVIVDAGSTASDTDTIINANDVTLINLGSGSPSLQVIGGSMADSEAHLHAFGVMNISATDSILVSGGATNSWAKISADGDQTITAGALSVQAGNGDGADALVHTDGNQAFTISDLIQVKGGTANGGSEASIHALVDQMITSNAIQAEGGVSGVNNTAIISAGDSQSIAVDSGGILIQGGNSTVSLAGNGNSATISLPAGATGSQTILVNNGGNLTIKSGNGIEDDGASISNNGTGDTTINGSGNLIITGGNSSKGDSFADAFLHSANNMTLTVNGDVNLTGGTGYKSEAAVSSNSNLDVTVNGGSVTLQGGSGNEAEASISGDVSLDLIVTGGNLFLNGGGGPASGASLGGPDISADISGIIKLEGGSGANAFAAIGSDNTSTTINIGSLTPSNAVELRGGTGANAGAVIGAVGAGNDANVTINGGGSVTLFGGAGGALIGTSTDHGDITIKTGLLGSGDLTLNYGEILTTDNIVLEVAGLLSLNGGASLNQASRIVSDTGTLTVNADALEQIAGSGNYANAVLDANNGMTLNITGNAFLQAGNGDYAQAEISSRTGLQDINIGGSFTIQGGGGIEANASTNAEGGGNLEMDVTGDLILSGGSDLDASASVTTEGGGTIDLSVGGSLILTGGSGQDSSAGIGSGGSINIDVAGDFQMSGGVGQTSAVIIGSTDTSAVIDIGSSSPIGGDMSISGGTGANALAIIGALGAGNDAAITIETNDSLTLNKQTGGVLIGSELAGGTVDIKAGMDGTGSIALNDGLIQLNGNTSLQATASGGTITQNSAGIINIYNTQLNVSADARIDLPGANTVGQFAPGTNSGGVTFNQVGNLVVNGLNAGGGDATLSATGSVTQMAAINNTNLLTVTSGTGITLTDTANSVSHFSAADTGGAGISYHNNGNLGLGLVDAGAGNFSLTVASDIVDGNGGTMNIIANLADLAAPGGSAGTIADPLETQVNTLVVTDADVEVGIHNNGPLSISAATFPAAVTADILLIASTIDFSGSLSTSGSLDLRGANGITVDQNLDSGGALNLAGGSGTLDINGVQVLGTSLELSGNNITIRNNSGADPVGASGNVYVHGGNLTVDSGSLQSGADMTLQTSSVTLQANGSNDSLVYADTDMIVNTGSLQVIGSTTSSRYSKLEANGTMNISANSVTVQGGAADNANASIDPTSLVMNVSGDVSVLGGAGFNSYAEISADTVEITAGPTASAGNINITGGAGDYAGAWIESTSGDVILIAGDTTYPADIMLIGGTGVNADAYIDAGGGAFDVNLTFHNGTGLVLLPALTGATDVGILAMNLILNSYNPFFQPPVDPITNVVSSQEQMDELIDESTEESMEEIIVSDEDEEEEKKKKGRLVCH